MFAIIRTRWQTRPLSRRAKRRSSAAPGSLRKKYAGIAYPPNMVRLPNNSTTSGDPRKPVLFMPSQMYGGSGVDHRLPIAWFLLLIASSAPRFPSRRLATAIGFVAGAVLVFRLAGIAHTSRHADESESAAFIGVGAAPPDVTVA